ncbi:uncharacterized protein JCM6883_003464 [Sporobolomyces salmoneus]|uniref:uncharacterized protein n=1 Tax=Sporobolomyces salmoneus TaxID=183962 RepID=UPI003170713C
MSVHQEYRLFISNEAYTLIGDHQQTLTIDRATGQLDIKAGSILPKRCDQEVKIFGIFGIISLLKSDYLIVITKRTKITRILQVPVYSANDFALYPISRNSPSSTVESLTEQPQETYLLGLIKSHLYSAPFYFTYDQKYNLTMRLQQQQEERGDEEKEKPLWETADDRFFWNKHLHKKLINATTIGTEQDYSKFILPVMFGFLEFKTTSINGRTFQFGLISRRNRYRAGTRYFSRGIDQQGNVSNFNETEQLVLLDKEDARSPSRGILSGGEVKGDLRFSFVQTRGSVPVYWAEINNLRYKPDLKIMDLSSTIESLSRHFDQQISLYGSQILVNLVNQKGYEKPVKEAYERAIEGLKNDRLQYVYFDFHHECKGLRFDRVGGLIDGLDQELNKQAYFYHDTTESPLRAQIKQISVVRTNCMDCLDRTNVVQSALAKWVLNNQLREIGVLSVKESVDEHAQFLDLFRNIWADNADTVSKAYSGTGALKTDYTRTGKRSKEGALQDGIDSLMRYIKNNFLDGPRQDAYDLVTGTWEPRRSNDVSIGSGVGEDVGDWLRDKRDLVSRVIPWVGLVSLIVLIGVVMFPNFVSQYVASTRKLTLLSLILLGVATQTILNNGIDYVAQPKLMRNALDDVLNYSGKGYESGRRGRPLKNRQTNKERLVSVEQSAKHRQLKKERKESILPNFAASTLGGGGQAQNKLD